MVTKELMVIEHLQGSQLFIYISSFNSQNNAIKYLLLPIHLMHEETKLGDANLPRFAQNKI